MGDEINYSVQTSSQKKHAVNKTTTIKFFASRLPEVGIAFGCNSSENINLWDRKDPGSVPSRSELLVVVFFNCQTTMHEDPGSTPCRGEHFDSQL